MVVLLKHRDRADYIPGSWERCVCVGVCMFGYQDAVCMSERVFVCGKRGTTLLEHLVLGIPGWLSQWSVGDS